MSVEDTLAAKAVEAEDYNDMNLARLCLTAIDEIERLRGLVSVSGVLCDDCGEPAFSVSDDTARCENCLAQKEQG